jgi:hypothetical protein
MAKGRKRKAGERHKSGRLKEPTTKAERELRCLPNIRVVERNAAFNSHHFKGGGKGDQSGDGIGQLWLCHKLDGHGIADTDLLNVGRLYASLWFDRYPAAPKTATFEPRSRTTGEPPQVTAGDLMFNRMDEALPLYSSERKAAFELLISTHWMDQVASFVTATVNAFRLVHGLPVAGRIEGPADVETVEDAIRALFLLYDATIPRRRSLVAPERSLRAA